MQDPIELIAELGLPIASGLVMGYFIFLVMRQMMNGLVDEIKTIQGISKMLITRASIMNNDMIRLQEKVNTVIELREADAIPKTNEEEKKRQAEPKAKTTRGTRRKN